MNEAVFCQKNIVVSLKTLWKYSRENPVQSKQGS